MGSNTESINLGPSLCHAFYFLFFIRPASQGSYGELRFLFFVPLGPEQSQLVIYITQHIAF